MGAALGVALGGRHSSGFDREHISHSIDSMTEHRFGRAATDAEKFGPLYAVAGLTVVGGVFGAGCAVATRVLPVPAIAAGAVYGVCAWAASEVGYRRMPDAQQRWGFPPPTRTLSVFVLYGAAVAALTERRR